MAIKSWDLDIGSPEGHLKLEDSPSRLKEIKDHCATSGSFYAEAQTTPDRTIAIYEGVVYFGITKVEYAGLDIADLGPAGAFEVSALTVNYFNKILFTINSSGTLEATEGTEAATAGTAVAPSISAGKFPICIVTVQDDGTGTAGTILTIEQSEIMQIQAVNGSFEDTTTNSIDKIWTYQDTAPAGWNIVASTTDALLACKGGANAYNTTGGQQIGTWTQPNHLHATGSHSLSIAELAAHTHKVGFVTNQSQTGGNFPGPGNAQIESGSTGSGDAHNHGNTGNSATVATYRPLANLGIIIEKT